MLGFFSFLCVGRFAGGNGNRMLCGFASYSWFLSGFPEKIEHSRKGSGEDFLKQYHRDRYRHYRRGNQCGCTGEFFEAYAEQRRGRLYAATVGEMDG